MSVPAPHVRGINGAIETAVYGVIFRPALGFAGQGASGLAKLLNRAINRFMRRGPRHLKAQVNELRHHALELQHGSPSGGGSFVPIAAPIVWAVFQLSAALSQDHKRFVLRWRFGRLLGE
jgi:hypothetical protein